MRWYVRPKRGHDDLVTAFFLALWASRRPLLCRLPLGSLAAVDTATFR